MNHIYLTRRNLVSLLNKLDRTIEGDPSYCAIVKNDTVHPKFPATTRMLVIAIEDEDYYTDREPGAILRRDLP